MRWPGHRLHRRLPHLKCLSISMCLQMFAPPDRKYWQEQSGKLGNRFDIEAVVGSRGAEHSMLLDRAKDLYDAGRNKPGAESEQAPKRHAADGQGCGSCLRNASQESDCFAQAVKPSAGRATRATARVTSHRVRASLFSVACPLSCTPCLR